MNITADELQRIMPACTSEHAQRFAQPLSDCMLEFFIDTGSRMCCFLAQIAHESMQLACTREIWGPTAQQLGYEGRIDLGNVQSGDGERFMGRGLIQITGRANYQRCSRALFRDERLLDSPELLEEPVAAARSAGWFWALRGLNRYADSNDFEAITLRVNGSLRTLAERREFLERARAVV
jgi:putative chitinase